MTEIGKFIINQLLLFLCQKYLPKLRHISHLRYFIRKVPDHRFVKRTLGPELTVKQAKTARNVDSKVARTGAVVHGGTMTGVPGAMRDPPKGYPETPSQVTLVCQQSRPDPAAVRLVHVWTPLMTLMMKMAQERVLASRTGTGLKTVINDF